MVRKLWQLGKRLHFFLIFTVIFLISLSASTLLNIQFANAQSNSSVKVQDNTFQQSLATAKSFGFDWLSKLPSCPCTEQEAKNDSSAWELSTGFFADIPFYHPGATSSYRSKEL